MKTRMHPLVILENILGFLFILIISFIYIINDNIKNINEIFKSVHSNEIIFIILLFILCIILITIYSFLKWYNTYIYFNKESFIIERGKLFKNKTTIHTKDIASINIKQNILEKIFKCANIKILLNTNENTYSGKLIFKYKDAMKIKNNIFKNEEEIQSLINFNTKDVLRHIFLNANILVLIILLLIYIPVICETLKEVTVVNIIILIITTIIFVTGIIFKALKTILNYSGFKVNRNNNYIKISHGILTTYKYNVPVNKINAVIIKRSLQARIMGYYLVEIVNAGLSDNEDEKTIVSLYVNRNNLNLIFNDILSEYKNSINLEKETKIAPCIINSIPLIIICIIFVKPLLILLIILIYLVHKTNKIGMNDKFIIIKKGFFLEKINIINIKKIEMITFEKNIGASFTNLWQVRINIVSNENSTFKSGYFEKDKLKNIETIYR